MHSPYTLDFSGSFFAAQSCAGLLLTALLLFWRFGPTSAKGLMLLGIWVAVIGEGVAPFLKSLGYQPGEETLRQALMASAALGTVAAVLAKRPLVAVVAAAGQVLLWKLDGFIKDSDTELTALHLAWLGLLLGLLCRARGPRPLDSTEAEPSYVTHDAVVFAAATALAALVCLFVMHKRDGSADEWAYTYQAALFAKGRAYAHSPRCQPYLQNFYVFETSGRLFGQYTPGWPLFMVPFFLAGATWMAGPVAAGLMAAGLARLARSAMRGCGTAVAPVSPRAIGAAGTWAAVLAMFGTTILINAASRYPHVLVVALYAWSLEALLMVSKPGLPAPRQTRWGLVLGCASALLFATRPAEGAFLGVGIAVVFVYSLARGRVGWRALAMASAGFAFWAGLALVILRLQLGKWFTTGYSLNSVIYPWNVTKYDMPEPNQWKYGLPLATGAYCWWPCSLALGLAGLAMVGGRSLRLVVAIALGTLGYVIYCEWLDVGQRGFDWGYGPRYLMPLIVPMAVGGGIALAPLAIGARRHLAAGRSVMARGGPPALAVFALVSGWVRIVPLVWPTQAEHTRRHARVTTTIADLRLKNAIVLVKPGTSGVEPLDLTTNLPIDLYPNQDVIVAIERSPETVTCMRQAFPGRQVYRAAGGEDVRITRD